MPEPENYRKSLERKLRNAEKRLEQALEKYLKNPTMENISAKNNASVDVQIAQSRLDNLGKDPGGLDEVNINGYKL